MNAAEPIGTGSSATTGAAHVYGEPRQDWLDWLRGAAILLVLTSHYQVDWHEAGLFVPLAALCMRIGWAGVDMFFVLSGFLVGGLLLSETKKYGRIDARLFYLRRMLKIWPPLYCVPILYVLLMAAYGQSPAQSLAETWPILLHIQNYVPTPLGHMWSLAVEEHFYLLLPPLLMLVGVKANPSSVRRLQLVMLALIVGVGLLRVLSVELGWVDPRTARILTHLRIDALLTGVLIATVYHFQADRWSWLMARPWMFVGLAVLAAWPFVMNPNTSTLFAGVGYSSLIVLFSSLLLATARAGASWDARRWPLRAAAFVGRYSYPIYLFHPLIWKIMHNAGLGDPVAPLLIGGSKSVTWITGLIVFTALSIVVGVVFGTLIEKPILRVRNIVLPPRSLSLER
jgi:peptidoglycan/LPS O-acetylase OafA/YrhL